MPHDQELQISRSKKKSFMLQLQFLVFCTYPSSFTSPLVLVLLTGTLAPHNLPNDNICLPCCICSSMLLGTQIGYGLLLAQPSFCLELCLVGLAEAPIKKLVVTEMSESGRMQVGRRKSKNILALKPQLLCQEETLLTTIMPTPGIRH